MWHPEILVTSTGSAVPDPTVSLCRHPAHPCPEIEGIEVLIARSDAHGLSLIYQVHGHINRLALPARRKPACSEGLWKHTCFEAFIAIEGQRAYQEFNFSPSGEWAHYAFSAYRRRTGGLRPSPAPDTAIHHSPTCLEFRASLGAELLPSGHSRVALRLGLSAVLETVDGAHSFWALSHPCPQPDFHRRASFLISLSSL